MIGVVPRWIKGWLIASTLICSIDVAFTMLRPHSLRGGKYANYFFIWHLYADVDIRYGDPLDPITRVTGPLMCVELFLNLLALFLDLFHSGHALVCALVSSVLVFWKTNIYLCLYLGGNGIIAQTPFWKEFLLFWAPNSVWVFVPFAAIVQLWQIIARGWVPPTVEWKQRSGGTKTEAEQLHTLLTQRIMKNGNGKSEMCALDEMDPFESSRRSRKQNLALIERLKIFTGRTSKDEK